MVPELSVYKGSTVQGFPRRCTAEKTQLSPSLTRKPCTCLFICPVCKLNGRLFHQRVGLICRQCGSAVKTWFMKRHMTWINLSRPWDWQRLLQTWSTLYRLPHSLMNYSARLIGSKISPLRQPMLSQSKVARTVVAIMYLSTCSNKSSDSFWSVLGRVHMLPRMMS